MNLEKYNRLTIIKKYKIFAEDKVHYKMYTQCRCDCGNIIDRLYTRVKSGEIKAVDVLGVV